MPEYIYRCENKHEQGVIHSIRDNPTITCEECQSPMARKPQTVSSQFIGSGFYSTDKN